MGAANFYLMVYTTLLLFSVGFKKSYGHVELENSGPSSFFVFGDSTVDAGNNNYINTTSENQANYKPYGHNGFFENPTGRFSDGRTIVDYIAEYAQLPLIPPFLQPSAEYVNGVNFASAGAGVLPETNQDLVIDLKTQLKHFEKVQKSLIEKLGEAKAKEILSEAVYFISIGSNDYMVGYLGNPKVRELHHPEEYIGMVIGNLTNAIQELYAKGGRKFAFLSLSPLGCLPALRAINPKANEDACFEDASALALAHNHALKSLLHSFGNLMEGFKYCNSDFYSWLDHRIKYPFIYGFKEGMNACCGTGHYRGVFTCGGMKTMKEYELCDNIDDHIWWDSFHPTEKLHEQIAKELWHAAAYDHSVGPYNLKQLFADKEKKVIIADIVDDPERNQIF